MKQVSNFIDKITHYVSYVAMWATFFLMVMTAVHVILRKISPFSIPGAMELTELALVIIVFFAVGYLQSQGGHVRVNMFVDMFPARVRHFVNFVILLGSAVILYIMFYAGILQVQSQLETIIKTNVLLIPLWPFVIVMTIGLVFYALSLTIHAIRELTDGIRGADAGSIEGDKEVSFDV